MLEYLNHDTLYVTSIHKNAVLYVVADATYILQIQYNIGEHIVFNNVYRKWGEKKNRC